LGGCPRLYLAEERDDLMLVPEEIKQCVAFLCYKQGADYHLAGTGFFVSVTSPDGLGGFVYLVSARHVIEAVHAGSTDAGKLYVRLNTRAGGVELVEAPMAAWVFHHDDSVDVAVFPWAPDREVFEYRAVGRMMLATDKTLEEHSIGVGDEVFFPGLFVNHIGQKRNLPLVRVGNIAAMPEEPVRGTAFGDMEAYLIEARSVGGLSGSPVFAHLILGRGGNINLGAPRFFLLGLMHGHFNSGLTHLDDVEVDAPTVDRVNMGIALVVPSQRIIDVLEHPVLTDQREAIEKARAKKKGPVAD